MSKNVIGILLLLASMSLLPVAAWGLLSPFTMRGDSSPHVDTWQDDAQNWERAFPEKQPSQLQVIHSKVWKRTDNSTVEGHIADEFICYFEIQATPEWSKAFVREKRYNLEADTSPRRYRSALDTD